MIDRSKLEKLRRRYNQRRYVVPDPLQFLYLYPRVEDREIVGLIASALAYGRVESILKSVEAVLVRMGCSPRSFLLRTSDSGLGSIFRGFAHRFTCCNELVGLMAGMRTAISEHGSLNRCFLAGSSASDETVLPAMRVFAATLRSVHDPAPCSLIPAPDKGSACKRLNLFLRWMVRRDAVDPGGWTGIPRSKLVVPLDTHMAEIGRRLGFTLRRTNDIKTALDITGSFRAFAPLDPARYDFTLTRFGIRSELNLEALLRELSLNSG